MSLLPLKMLFRGMAAEITKQTKRPVLFFCMAYDVSARSLDYIVTHEDGAPPVKYGYESSVISTAIEAQAISKLPKGSICKFVLVYWHPTDAAKCYIDIRYQENGIDEKLTEPY